MANLRDKETKEQIVNHLKNIGGIITKYFKFTAIDCLIIGAVNLVVMLIAMLIGGGVFGIVGMILVVPVVAIMQYLYKNVYLSYINKSES